MTHRTAEVSAAYDGALETVSHGLVAGTRIASMLGWRGVELLAIGDLVLTFDNGMQEITDIRRLNLCFDGPETDVAHWPVVVPAGALGNKEHLTLLPDQGVMLESEAAVDIYGDPFAVVAAWALVGVRGIHRARPTQRVELISLSFAQDQVIYAEGGALILCTAPVTPLNKLLQGAACDYAALGQSDAAFLVQCFDQERSGPEGYGYPQKVAAC